MLPTGAANSVRSCPEDGEDPALCGAFTQSEGVVIRYLMNSISA